MSRTSVHGARSPRRAELPSALQGALLWFFAIFAVLLGGAGLGKLGRHALPAHDAQDPARAEGALQRLFQEDPNWIAFGTAVNEAAALLALGWALWFFRPSIKRVLPVARPRVGAVVGACLVVFGMAPLANAVSELVRRALALETSAASIITAATRNASSSEFAILLVTLTLIPALVEEAIFRGFITASFLNNRWFALVAPSLMFGLFHIEPSQAAGTTLLGLSFGIGRLATGSLLPSMIAHALYNGAVLLIVRHHPTSTEQAIEITPLIVGGGVLLLGLAVLRSKGKAPERAHDSPSES